MSLPSSKRKSSSTHHSDKQQRLEQNGIHMKSSILLHRESKELCNQLLEGNHEPTGCPCYPVEKIDDVLDRIHSLNEARLQRDVTPWVVPSAENLSFSGAAGLECIGEEINTEWVRCQPMGLSRPKPDFAAGLRRSAFRTEELEKLENYSTPQKPFYFTPDICFPFLICEAKTGRIGIDQADTQNMHSASIATKAILSLYAATFGREHEKTQNLLGRILVFTVSHNNRIVNLYGHYAVANANGSNSDGDETADHFQYFRYDIAMFSLSMYEGRERFKAYNFARNVYATFAPQHLQRIREAVSSMQGPVPRTGLLFAASDITLDERDSQQGSEATGSQGNDGFRTPIEPASALQKREMASMRGQLDKLLRQSQEQGKQSTEQLEQQRKESRDKEERMVQQMEQQGKQSTEQLEQQRKESRDKEERMVQQMEQQRMESREELEQQRKESSDKEERMTRQMEQQRMESREQLAQMMGMISRLQEPESRA
ncbi:hypothetical protein B0A54_16598 [Friedmanniomyces endolithicus]|uniref:DUF7924 domain-containing protein n=1 Tax=Friedmanniomyces endolithicus TaxID=329885 RepID=A0A4U0U9G3_9PEZI|nr:hypothetical protein B0A54_16598 [Friedmanniomyces endolithicus]